MKSVTDEISLNQFLIIKKIKRYLKELKKNKIDTSKSSFCNFSTYSESPGFFLVNLWIKNIYQINFLLGIFKNFYCITFHVELINCMNIFSIYDVKTSRESRWWKHHLILSSTRTTGATLIFTFRYPTSMYTLILGVVVP